MDNDALFVDNVAETSPSRLCPGWLRNESRGCPHEGPADVGHCTGVSEPHSTRLESLALDLLTDDRRPAFARMHAPEPRKEAVDGAASRHAGLKLFTGVGPAAARLLSALQGSLRRTTLCPWMSELDSQNIAGDFASKPGNAGCSSWFPRVEAV